MSDPISDNSFENAPSAADRMWRDWPRCPRCSCPRVAECPDCGEAGVEFSCAEFSAIEAPLESVRGAARAAAASAPSSYPLLECPSCGGSFTPVFYRRCALCGQEFADGKEPPSLQQASRLPWAYVLAAIALLLALVFLVWMTRPSNPL